MKVKIKILNIKKGLAKKKKCFQFVYTTDFRSISEPNSDMKELYETAAWRITYD